MSVVLFEKDSWRICEGKYTPGSVIYHHCGDERNTNNMWWYSTVAWNRHCSFCAEGIPDDIYGLWLLHEWDR